MAKPRICQEFRSLLQQIAVKTHSKAVKEPHARNFHDQTHVITEVILMKPFTKDLIIVNLFKVSIPVTIVYNYY